MYLGQGEEDRVGHKGWDMEGWQADRVSCVHVRGKKNQLTPSRALTYYIYYTQGFYQTVQHFIFLINLQKRDFDLKGQCHENLF